MSSDSVVTKLNKVAERILDPADGKPRQRQCRAMASEYIRGFLIGTVRNCIVLQREYSIEPTANPVRDSVGRWQVSICVDFNRKYIICLKEKTLVESRKQGHAPLPVMGPDHAHNRASQPQYC